MRNFTLCTKKILVAVSCLFSLSASAQYSATVAQDPTSDYSSVPTTFSLTQVAATLGTDTATLAQALNNWADNQPADDAGKMFFTVKADGSTDGNYTGNYGEFWLDESGAPHAYNGGAWFAGNSWDATNDTYTIYVGQMPNYFTAADTLKGKFALVFEGKQATFDITYVINKPVENPTDGILKNLTIVGEQTIVHHELPRTSYAADAINIKVSGLASLMGLTDEQLTKNFPKMLFAAPYDDTYGIAKDTLTNSYTAGAPGFWFRKVIDATGNYGNTLAATIYGDSCKYYIEAFKLNATLDTISANWGQFPGKMTAGDSLSTAVYIVWAQNAYKLNLSLVIDTPTYTGLENMTKVGEETDSIKGLFPNSQYLTQPLKFNITNIAALLGCDSTTVSLQGITQDGGLTTNSTANNGGYWMNAAGHVVGWGTGAAMFCEPVGMYDATHPNMSSMNVGLYPSGVAAGDTLRATLYITDPDNTKYYQINLVIPVGEQKKADALDIVAVKKATIQVIKSSTDYLVDGNQTKYYLTPDQANELIATTAPELYSLYADSLWQADGTGKYNKSDFICTPAPGFWLGDKGQAHGWSNSDTAPVGICYDKTTGLFTVYQAPGATNEVGTAYNTSLFLVNEDTKKAIEIAFTIQWVDKLEDVTEVGTTAVTIPVSLQETTATLDLAAIAKALGLTDAQTLLTGGYYLKGLQENGLYSEGVDPIGSGLMFDRKGYCNNLGGVFGFNVNADDLSLIVFSNEEIEAGFKANSTICFQVDTKRYVVNITFMNADDYATGVKTVETSTREDGKLYDLSGREVNKATKGIYIRNGKKFVVK